MFPIQTNVYARRVPILTWTLIGINVLVFFVESQLDPKSLQTVFHLFGIVPARYTDPEWAAHVGFPVGSYWPFVTSMFLHGGIMHLVGNMWTLAIFGRNVEDQLGPVRFVAFYLVCGILSGVVHTVVNADSVIPAIGASGAIAGVMGAYLALFPTSRVVVMVPILLFPFFFDFLAVFYLAYWFVLQLLSGFLALSADVGMKGGIAFWAHVGGFVAGLALIGPFLPSRVHRPRCHADEGCIEHAWSRI